MNEGTDLMSGDGVIVTTGATALMTGTYVGTARDDAGKHVVELEDGRVGTFVAGQIKPLLRTFHFNTGALLIIEGAEGEGPFLWHCRDARAEADYREKWGDKFGKKIVGRIDLMAAPIQGREAGQ